MNIKIRVCAAALTAVLTAGSAAGAASMPEGTNTGAASLEINDIAKIAELDVFGNKEIADGSVALGEFPSELGEADADSEEETSFDAETAYAVAINGEDILYVATEEDAKAVLDGLVSSFSTPGAEVVEILYGEEISYKEKDIVTAAEAEKNKRVTETYICDVDEAVRYILNGTAVPLTYTVKGGDTLWDIALANNISVYELEQMNPGATQKLSVGQTINLYQQNPFVHITVTEIVTETQSIPYGVSYTNSDSLYKGQIQVQSAGVNGSKQVTLQQTKTNGVLTASTVLGETVTAEPVTQIALTGTKQISVQSGSGYLQYPVASVEISSPYGASRGGGSRSHKGIDLRAPKGTAVMASDAGTVVFAGYSGSYGNIIRIDHGNGVVTKYAHCDSIGVTVGQNVQKGEVIGTVGSTGNATGNVLHFEVVINGVQKNPVSYL